jgi:hypothetical protein
VQQADRFRLRRRLAIGVVAVLILIPIYMLFIRDDSDSSPPTTRDLVEAAKSQSAADAVLVQAKGDHKQGIEIHYPSDWDGVLDKGTVRVTGPDKQTVVAVTAKAEASQSKALFRAAVNGVGVDFKDPKLTYAKHPGPISGLPSAQAFITGNVNGTPRKALVAVVRGRHRAYVVAVFVPANGGDAGTANLIISRGLVLSG